MAKVRVTVEMKADLPNDVPEQVTRKVTENSVPLKFSSQGFSQT